MIYRLIKISGWGVALIVGVAVLFKIGELAAGVNIESVNVKRNSLLTFASYFQLIRAIGALFLFLVLWNPFCSLIFNQCGLEINSVRWRWLGFYLAVELVIFVQIFGDM